MAFFNLAPSAITSTLDFVDANELLQLRAASATARRQCVRLATRLHIGPRFTFLRGSMPCTKALLDFGAITSVTIIFGRGYGTSEKSSCQPFAVLLQFLLRPGSPLRELRLYEAPSATHDAVLAAMICAAPALPPIETLVMSDMPMKQRGGVVPIQQSGGGVSPALLKSALKRCRLQLRTLALSGQFLHCCCDFAGEATAAGDDLTLLAPWGVGSSQFSRLESLELDTSKRERREGYGVILGRSVKGWSLAAKQMVKERGPRALKRLCMHLDCITAAELGAFVKEATRGAQLEELRLVSTVPSVLEVKEIDEALQNIGSGFFNNVGGSSSSAAGARLLPFTRFVFSSNAINLLAPSLKSHATTLRVLHLYGLCDGDKDKPYGLGPAGASTAALAQALQAAAFPALEDVAFGMACSFGSEHWRFVPLSTVRLLAALHREGTALRLKSVTLRKMALSTPGLHALGGLARARGRTLQCIDIWGGHDPSQMLDNVSGSAEQPLCVDSSDGSGEDFDSRGLDDYEAHGRTMERLRRRSEREGDSSGGGDARGAPRRRVGSSETAVEAAAADGCSSSPLVGDGGSGGAASSGGGGSGGSGGGASSGGSGGGASSGAGGGASSGGQGVGCASGNQTAQEAGNRAVMAWMEPLLAAGPAATILAEEVIPHLPRLRSFSVSHFGTIIDEADAAAVFTALRTHVKRPTELAVKLWGCVSAVVSERDMKVQLERRGLRLAGSDDSTSMADALGFKSLAYCPGGLGDSDDSEFGTSDDGSDSGGEGEEDGDEDDDGVYDEYDGDEEYYLPDGDYDYFGF